MSAATERKDHQRIHQTYSFIDESFCGMVGRCAGVFVRMISRCAELPVRSWILAHALRSNTTRGVSHLEYLISFF